MSKEAAIIRRKMQGADWLWAALAIVIGFFIAMIVGSLIVMMFEGLWILLIIAIPFVALQLIFEGALRGLWALGRRLLGYPPKPPPPVETADAEVPWLRHFGLWIGAGLGLVFVAIQTFRFGGLLS